MYDATVFDKIHTCKPSHRNELEITDVNNAYIEEGTMTYLVPRWLVDRCGHVRFAAARRESGGRQHEQAIADGRVNSHPRLRYRFRKCEKGIGDVILAIDSPKLIAGVDVRACRALAGRPRLLPRSAAHRGGACGAFSERVHADFGGVQLSRHHQGVSLSPAPDGLLDAGDGMLQVALVDLRPESPTFGRRNTIYVGSIRPWQILIPPGVAHGYKVVGTPGLRC